MKREDNIYQIYVQILKEELVTAMGCTEPIAISYAAARARAVLGELPEKIVVKASGSIINGTVENSILFKKTFVGNNCVIMNSIILNDVYLGDNAYIENCIVESRDTIRANTRYVGENGVKVVVEKNERYAL